MNRIDLPHLVWALESLAADRVVNQIVVDAETQKWARVALDRTCWRCPGRCTAGGLRLRAPVHPTREPPGHVLLYVHVVGQQIAQLHLQDVVPAWFRDGANG